MITNKPVTTIAGIAPDPNALQQLIPNESYAFDAYPDVLIDARFISKELFTALEKKGYNQFSNELHDKEFVLRIWTGKGVKDLIQNVTLGFWHYKIDYMNVRDLMEELTPKT